jgi:hypothetical protein
MAHQQSLPNHTHDAVSPLVPSEYDSYSHEQNIGDDRLSSEITPHPDQDDEYAYRVTIVDNKPQFTPASTLGPDDDFWMGKTGSTEIKVNNILSDEVSYANTVIHAVASTIRCKVCRIRPCFHATSLSIVAASVR